MIRKLKDYIEVTEKRVTLDANHPFVGENLTFEIELIEIV